MDRDDKVVRQGGDAEPGCSACAPEGAGRRALFKAAVALGIAASLPRVAMAAPAKIRAKAGDRFVYVSGDKEGSVVSPDDLTVGGPQILAWPADGETGKPRDESLLNQVLLIRLDPSSLDEATKAHAADGIVAYSAICTHAQCPVAGWNTEKHVFHCPCHNSEYDPRHGAKVVFGPAPRPLAALPLKVKDGVLVADGTFLGRIGTRPA
jgi:Rieske Fe-S protein